MDKNNYQSYHERIQCFNKLKFWQELIKTTENDYNSLVKITNKPQDYKSILEQVENYYDNYKIEYQRCQNIIKPQ